MRAGQTEASVDLARLAGLTPAGVICEIMNDDGTMARVPQLIEFCKRHDLKMISVAELIRYRMKHEKFIRRVAEGIVHTEFGDFRTIAYASDLNPEYHLALVRGDVAGKESVLVRMHSRCVFGDVFAPRTASAASWCENSLRAIAEEGQGVLVYLHETGPGFRIESGQMVTHGRDFMHYKGEDGQRQLQHEHGLGAQILSRSGPAHHPPAHQSPAQDRRPGRLRHRGRGADSGRALKGAPVFYLPVFGISLSVPAASRACRTVIKSARGSGVNSPDKKSRISRAVLC